MKLTKNRKKLSTKFNRDESYSIEEAVKLVKSTKYTSFDESVDLAINLGVDPRHAEASREVQGQQLRPVRQVRVGPHFEFATVCLAAAQRMHIRSLPFGGPTFCLALTATG